MRTVIGFASSVLLTLFLLALLTSASRQLDAHTHKFTCGRSTAMKQFYFQNKAKMGKSCKLVVRRQNAGICQLKLEFKEFALHQPQNENSTRLCVNDAFFITTGFAESSIPVLCGENAGQHIFIPVRKHAKRTIATLNFKLQERNSTNSREKMPRWRIKVTQLRCSNSAHLDPQTISYHIKAQDVTAPTGCLQYFTEPEGEFESFNYNRGYGSYTGNLVYSICFKRSVQSCGIKFVPVQFQLGYDNNASNYTDRDCDTQLEGQNLINDYLFIPNGITESGLQASKFCNDALRPNMSVFSNVPGPLQIFFHSGDNWGDVKDTQIGFKMKYQLVNC